jgi:hypothetical protein
LLEIAEVGGTLVVAKEIVAEVGENSWNWWYSSWIEEEVAFISEVARKI